MKYLFLLLTIFAFSTLFSQNTASISGRITVENKEMQQATIEILKTKYKTQTDSLGIYKIDNIPAGNYKFQISSLGLKTISKNIILK
ncbi:TonB-dependent receptor, partial [Flavobacterium bomense]